jgi:hypothetical protein
MNKIFKSKKFWFWVFIILFVLVLLYYFTYVLANKQGKIIYQDTTRRIYLNLKKEYKPGREMWRMVYEDQKTGKRFFIMGNSVKGFSEKKMAKIVLNTIDQGKNRSFDQVQSAGIVIKEAKTDVHSNLISKKTVGDFLPDESEIGTALKF